MPRSHLVAIAVTTAVVPVVALSLSSCTGPGTDLGPAGSSPSQEASGEPSPTGPVDGDHGAFSEPVSPHAEVPALTRLDPDLLAAVRAAAREAEEHDVPMVVTSGWRSAAFQQQLYDEALVRYGSEQEALRWALTPELSSHVTGEAVDIGQTEAAYWLGQHGHRWGLCQPFANEIWHFELLTEPGGQCPAQIPDAAS